MLKHIIQAVILIYTGILLSFAWKDVCEAQSRIDHETQD